MSGGLMALAGYIVGAVMTNIAWIVFSKRP